MAQARGKSSSQKHIPIFVCVQKRRCHGHIGLHQSRLRDVTHACTTQHQADHKPVTQEGNREMQFFQLPPAHLHTGLRNTKKNIARSQGFLRFQGLAENKWRHWSKASVQAWNRLLLNKKKSKRKYLRCAGPAKHTGLRHEEHDVRKEVSRAMARFSLHPRWDLRCFYKGRICHSLRLSFFSPSMQGQLPACCKILFVSSARLCFILRILTSYALTVVLLHTCPKK